jgi:ubiquitin C-terminal hydrolase
MGSICDTFKNNDQQDSHEFLNVLLNTIHDEVRAKVTMKYENVPYDVKKYMDFMVYYETEATEMEKQSCALELEEYKKSNKDVMSVYNAYKYWGNYVAPTIKIPNIENMNNDDKNKALKKKEDLEKAHSMITNLFTGLYYSTVICDECKNVTETFEPFTILSLHIKESGNTTLEQSLSDFTQEETLTGENQFECTKCKKNVDAKRKTYIWESPQILIIQFKRFKNTNFTVNFTNKIMTQVDFPLENLDVAPQLSELHKVDKTKYNLCATSSHTSRTCNMGHYVAYTKNSLNNLWYEFDDDDVFCVAPDKVKDKIINKDAYILFYVKQ